MDLIGKTVRWEGRTGMAGHWYTARVRGTYDAEYDDWMVEVLDSGTREDLAVGTVLYASADRITVIDSEPVTEDEECE
jgi:hypothetical protein